MSLLHHWNSIKLLLIPQLPLMADNIFPFFCHSDRRGVERFLYHGECRDHCPPGHYHLEHTCVPCPGHCEVCLNSSHCKRCFRGYYLTQNVCEKHSCREGKPSVGDNKFSIQFVTEICLSILKNVLKYTVTPDPEVLKFQLRSSPTIMFS